MARRTYWDSHHHAMWTDEEWATARGITVRQPWAWGIAACDHHPEDGKGVENRSRGFPSSYRGPLLIHAGLGWSERGAADQRLRVLWGVDRGILHHGPLEQRRFVFGEVIAVAELADVHPSGGCCQPWGEEEYVGADQQLHRGVMHLVLEHVHELDQSIPHKGALGLWRPPAELLAAVGEQVGRAA
jgi:hypothetical protein